MYYENFYKNHWLKVSVFKMALHICFLCGIKKDDVKTVAFKECNIIFKCNKIITHNHNLCKYCLTNLKRNLQSN